MKKLLLFYVLSLCGLPLAAQHSVTGCVVENASGGKIPYATAVLQRPDSSFVAGCIADSLGLFSMANIPSGSYTLLISFLGYENVSRNIDVPAQREAGEFRLNESSTAISQVVVVGQRPFVEQRTDRYVVNVGNNILTAGRNAIDVLANTPGVMVDGSKISVMGREVIVYIDGRPSRVSGSQLNALLSSIQGDNVSRVEVITNPSSRYDAGGTGGIIDIRTKKGLSHGFNGSIDAGYRQGRRDSENAGFTMNYRRKSFNIFGNYSINRSNTWARLSQLNGTESDGVTHRFEQAAVNESDKARINQTYRFGIDYYLNDKNIVGLLYNGYRSGSGVNIQNGLTTISPALDGVASSSMMRQAIDDNNGNQLNLNYQGTFAKPGQQLSIDLDYGKFESRPSQMSVIDYFDGGGLSLDERSERLRHANPQGIEVWSARIDYDQPLWKDARLEIGGKSSGSTTDNNLRYEEYATGGWVIDTDRSNNFVYSEQIHAGYLTLHQALGKVSLQAGLRGEYTESEGDQRTTGEVNRRTWFDLFPTLYMNYRMSQKHQLVVSYGRRILRPNYGQLNPFEIKLDAYSFESGNPDLKPSYIDNFSFSYMMGQSVMIQMSYNNTKDVISHMPVQQDGRYGMVRTNFGQRESVTGMVNYRVAPVKVWSLNLAVMAMYSHNRSAESFGMIDNESVATQVQLANTFRISPTFSAELTGQYQSKLRDAYIEMKPMGSVSLGIRKSFFNNKFTVSLTGNDLFNTSERRLNSITGERIYQVNILQDTRYVNLSVRYNFSSGNAKAARRRTSGIEDERNRAQ